MLKFCIIYNESKDKANKIYKECYDYLKQKKIEILDIDEIYNCDFLIVIGGDGTLLRAFKKINDISKNLPKIIAINAGSMGYLTEVTYEKYKEIIDDVINDNYRYEERYFMEVSVYNKKYYSLNEVVVNRDNKVMNIIDIEIYSNNNFLAKYQGDGILISTPTGSTAYSLSIGGPIVIPSLSLFLISPIATHNLNTRPIILDGDMSIDLIVDTNNNEAFLNVDGQFIGNVKKDDRINIKYSDRKLMLVIPKDRNYYDVLRRKLKWGDNLC